jgi:hypothetical protein
LGSQLHKIIIKECCNKNISDFQAWQTYMVARVKMVA